MKRPIRLMFALLWLTFGYWIIGGFLHFIVALIPFAQGGSGGITVSSERGFHKVQFSGTPGDAILVLVRESGDQTAKFPAHVTGSSQDIYSVNAYSELVVALLFAAISLPVLSRLLRIEVPSE